MKRYAAVLPFMNASAVQPSRLPLVTAPPLTQQLKPAYQVDKLVAAAVETPPDLKSLASLFDFVRNKHLNAADRTNRAEALLYVAESVAKSKPRSFGVAEESAVYEMRLRLVARSLRHFVEEYPTGRVEHAIAKDIHDVLHYWRKVYHNKYARNGASEFKVHEAYSLLAIIPDTQTRGQRFRRKVIAATLLGAAVASAFVPFLAVGRGAVSANIMSAALGNSVGATGMVAFDLLKDVVTPRPKVKPWFPHYMNLRNALGDMKKARKHQAVDADAQEACLAERLANAHPRKRHLFNGKYCWWGRYRRVFLLGTLDVTERFLSHAQNPASFALCIPTVRDIAYWYNRDNAVAGRALEVLMSINALVASRSAAAPTAEWNSVAATIHQVMGQVRFSDGFDTAHHHWVSRNQLGYTLTVGEVEASLLSAEVETAP